MRSQSHSYSQADGLFAGLIGTTAVLVIDLLTVVFDLVILDIFANLSDILVVRPELGFGLG